MSDKQLILNTVQKIDDALGYEEILYTLYSWKPKKELEIWKPGM